MRALLLPRLCVPLGLLLLGVGPARGADNIHAVGAAKVDITPRYAVRLSGFAFRRAESEGVGQRIWVRALAVGKDEPAVVLAVDNLGVSTEIVAELAKRLAKKGVKADRLAVTATHTHTAPVLASVCPTIFGMPIPKEHQQNIDRYTREFTNALERAALAALADRQPARLSWGVGKVTFAVNRRRRPIAPVDHDLPLLAVRDLKGKVRAVWLNYACHAVTLSYNKISGDWPGYAAVAVEDEHPSAVALVSIGCGADSNPSSGVTGDKIEVASRQGLQVGKEVKRLLGGHLAPVTGPLVCTVRTVELPLAELPTKEQWQARAAKKDAIGHHARVNLERLARGEMLRSKIDYRVQTWAFGDALGVVFLPGEVVADYALRLKKELDGRRLWVNAYSNDSPGYVPSERVLKEGGYEGGGAMTYYDIPAPYRAGLEQKVVDAVKGQLGKAFAARLDPRRTGGSLPLSPPQSLATIRLKKGLTADVVAAEPLVASPVAIDFAPDGRLYVAEMFDYPSGLKGDFKPGGRVRVLEDSDGDGIYDKATIFLDNIPFPTGVTVWRKGVLVCTAPDILYAEDTKGTGKADRVVKLFSGFGTDNYQARVNSLHYGLDGWVYGSCGLFGGRITSHRTGKVTPLGDRDFRIRPDTGEIEAAVGRTQQGRARDDRGNWFGCDNSTLARHLVLPDHYLRRNPHVAYSGTSTYIPDYADSNRLYPAGSLQLFALSGPAGRATGACGLGVYRDDLLGKEYSGNLFTCEPVNLLVHRLTLSPRGSTFSARRAADEKQSEFLAATDSWFRPVQVRTGPDGALWVVDMYRFVIEHPQWIPTADLARLDVRAGAGLGRIYRVRPTDRPLRRVPRLDKLSPAELAAALDSPNGTVRDLAGQMLLWGKHTAAAPALEKLCGAARPEARLYALCALDGLGKLTPALVVKALGDTDAGVRRHAVRLAEKFVATRPEVGRALLKRVEDDDAQVRLQLAFSLGEWRGPAAAKALAQLASRHAADGHLVSAVLSSLHAGNAAEVLAAVLEAENPPPALVRRLLAVAAVVGEKTRLAKAVPRIVGLKEGRFETMAALYDALERRQGKMPDLGDNLLPKRFDRLFSQARAVAADEKAPRRERLGALALLGRRPEDAETLARLLTPRHPPEVQSAALAALGRQAGEPVAATLLAGWKNYSPALRGQALDLLLARPAWTARLLAALEKKEVEPGQIDATRRQRLLTHRDAKVRGRAAKVFAAASGDRAGVFKEYEAALARQGDAGRGKEAFAKHCAACHRLEGVGHDLGPDLSALVNKTPRYLLQEILDPNRNLDSRYQQYQATTARGQTFTGLLAAETATSVTLRWQDGKSQQLLRGDLEELSGTGKSLMPEGLEKDIAPARMADLLAYLTRQTRPFKQFAGNRPVTVRPARGAFALMATTGEIRGGDICFEPPFANVGHWHGEGDHVVWTLEVPGDSTYDVWLDYSCADAVAGNGFVLDGGREPLHGKAEATGGWERYRRRKLGRITLSAGTLRLTFRPAGPPRGALLDLRGVYLVPPGETPVFALLHAEKPADVKEVAKQLLDDKLPRAKREALVADHPSLAAELLAAMTADLKPGTKEEYRRIPWIWRVAVAAGRRNDAATLKKVLDVSLPKEGEPLRDWQAVVIGGGVINGVSLVGVWPRERIAELIKDSAERKKRWERALTLSAAMADDVKVPTGTRYDALRMIALDTWERRGAQLAGYLKKGTHDELMMGAISGLSDVDSPRVAPLLIGGLGHFSASNRRLAVEALLRTEARTLALLDAVAAGTLKKDVLSAAQAKALREHRSDKVRARAAKVL